MGGLRRLAGGQGTREGGYARGGAPGSSSTFASGSSPAAWRPPPPRHACGRAKQREAFWSLLASAPQRPSDSHCQHPTSATPVAQTWARATQSRDPSAPVGAPLAVASARRLARVFYGLHLVVSHLHALHRCAVRSVGRVSDTAASSQARVGFRAFCVERTRLDLDALWELAVADHPQRNLPHAAHAG